MEIVTKKNKHGAPPKFPTGLGCVGAQRLETALEAWEACAEFELGLEQIKPIELEVIRNLSPRQQQEEMSRLAALPPEVNPFFIYDQGIKNWAGLRGHLLKARPETTLDADFEKMHPVKDKALGSLSTFPRALYRWLGCSKRIYTIPANLQVLLHATSLQDVALGDLRLQFPSFVLSLAIPIVDELGKRFDTILISQDEIREDLFALQIFVLGEHTEEYARRMKACAREVSTHVKRRNELAAQTSINRWIGAQNRGEEYASPHIHRLAPIVSLHVTIPELVKVAATRRKPGEGLDGFSPDQLSEWGHRDNAADMHEFRTVVYGIVFNVLLYLRTLGTTPPFEATRGGGRPREPRQGQPDLGAITDEALVCRVADDVELPLEIMQQFGKGYRAGRHHGTELSAHFRTGHWRRPPGFGEIPFAEKTVWVRPTLVRRDRLPEAALPEGRIALPPHKKAP
ncbi:MAG: hypothetical protein A3J66_00920 [Candidatus Magasanikbacteria bacterium RIFCSPHIGHO2_02_FULL_47_14]|uniref:Uncharacterized protein n=1 Tax=Candidatus Magasanikbacteria bacterium RIFCSPHIGHO2_02_FULL_47_14 TaxID=1798680 RepID=A0A1F6LYM9_9BACT|nr:MAG: hypothetical protein A3J66_00920 [Candidatus Magasanikbacteria bacterium RIFCSPHIGHO2_02_FULL_47_14]